MCSNVKIIKQKKKEKCFFNYWFWKVLTRSNGLLNVNDVNFIMVGVLGSETSLGTGEESLALALRAGGKVSYKKYNLLLYCWHLFPITLIIANSAFLSFGRWVCDPEQPLRNFRWVMKKSSTLKRSGDELKKINFQLWAKSFVLIFIWCFSVTRLVIRNFVYLTLDHWYKCLILQKSVENRNVIQLLYRHYLTLEHYYKCLILQKSVERRLNLFLVV